MKEQINTRSQQKSVHSGSLIKRMLQAGAVALFLIAAFLLSADHVNPEWSKYWMVKPLILTPMVASLGGVLYYYLDHLRTGSTAMKIVAAILSLLGFVFFLWMGFVLGLNGTFWN